MHKTAQAWFIGLGLEHMPHGAAQVPLLFGSVAMEKVACRIVHWIFRRTGRHLILSADDEGQPPLLQRMVEDHDDLYFISALRAFKRRVVYANADCDRILIISAVGNFLCGVHVVCFIIGVVYFWLCASLMDKPDIVGWRTSSVRRNKELPELPVSSSEKYPHIVHEEHSEETDDDKWQDCMPECDMDVLEGG